MKSSYWLLLLLLFFLLLTHRAQRRSAAAAAVHHLRHRGKERGAVEAIVKQFVGTECILYTISSNDGSIQGTIREVSGGAILLEDRTGQRQVINLEYVTRVREYPRNKKGKKKSVVVD